MECAQSVDDLRASCAIGCAEGEVNHPVEVATPASASSCVEDKDSGAFARARSTLDRRAVNIFVLATMTLLLVCVEKLDAYAMRKAGSSQAPFVRA